jgi:hypothetical protein
MDAMEQQAAYRVFYHAAAAVNNDSRFVRDAIESDITVEPRAL